MSPARRRSTRTRTKEAAKPIIEAPSKKDKGSKSDILPDDSSVSSEADVAANGGGYTPTTDPELDVMSTPMSSKQAANLGAELNSRSGASSATRKSSRLSGIKRKIVLLSDDDDDNDSDDSDFRASPIPDSENEPEPDPDDVMVEKVILLSEENADLLDDLEVSSVNVVGNGVSDVLEVTYKERKSTKRIKVDPKDEDENGNDGKEAPKKKKRAPRKKKKDEEPDVPDEWGRTKTDRPNYLKYYKTAQEGLYDFHPELKTIFKDMEERGRYTPKSIPQPETIVTKLLPFQREGLDWLIHQEQSQYAGSILADEMGMGKTIQTVALMANDNKTRPQDQPNLVVTPTVALIQWQNEIREHTGDQLSVYIYHGSARSKDFDALREYDVILTTYAVVESVFRRQQSGFKRKGKTIKEASPLHNIQFHRIVLDEAHNIKDRQSNTARAVFSMQSTYRLCLSGTPLQNRVGEVYSLLRFLKVDPFSFYFCKKCPCKSFDWLFFQSNYCAACDHRGTSHCNFFNHSLLKHIQEQGAMFEGLDSMHKLRLLMGQLMLRRTKVERADDLGLPPRIVEIRRHYFNEEEKDLYASIYSDSNRRFETYVNQGVVLNNYANIFTLITRMRQIADHPDLVLRKKLLPGSGSGSGGTEEDTTRLEAAINAMVCKICDDEAEDAIESRCHHVFCRMCIQEYMEGFTGRESELECPVCHVGLTIDLSAPAIEVDSEVVKKASIVNRIDMSNNWRSSTKIEALVEELYNLRSDKQTIKSIVFSQFTSMLDLVEWRLKRAGFETVKLQGSMSPAQRDGIIRHFMENPSVEIFLVSLKAGGVALNLCEASQVFILDPWWNPSVEWQSGDRVHRIGQHRPVKITRLIIEDSIESRIVELQDKKASMINATIAQDDAAMNRLTPADMQFLFQN